MKELAAIVGAAALTLAACATSRETKIETEGSATTIKQTGPGENVKTTTVTGTVMKYDPGQELEIKAADGNSHDFDLEDSVTIQGSIVVGQPVTVTYTDVGGLKKVTIISAVSIS
jgi:Flp pilus assembly protein TadG